MQRLCSGEIDSRYRYCPANRPLAFELNLQSNRALRFEFESNCIFELNVFNSEYGLKSVITNEAKRCLELHIRHYSPQTH